MNSTETIKAKKPKKTIKEQKAESKFLFQFIDHETGKRSEPFVSSWDKIHEILELRKEGEKPVDKDYILLVAVIDDDDTTIPGTPLITIKTLLQFKNDQTSVSTTQPETRSA